MKSEMSASFKHEDLVKELLSDIEENLEPELDSRQCCIYRVHKDLRRVNEEAYTPQLVSIGPLHHGKEQLVGMEKKKKSYMKSFLERITPEKPITPEKIDTILSFIKDNEKNIRNCYAETSNLTSIKYVMMILYDTIFIVELLIRYQSKLHGSDLLLSTTVKGFLCVDFLLLENQLPYFVLEDICKLAFANLDIPTFMELSCCFFNSFDTFKLSKLIPQVTVEHFNDWKRTTMLESYLKSESTNGWVSDLPCAVKLHESGVKFKCSKEGGSLLDISFEKRNQRIPYFEVHELQIPHLDIYDDTERLLRNIMALEQHHYPRDTQVCNYISMMDDLINTEKDVDLLVGNQIISHYMGDNASVASMFNKLGQHIILSKSSYYDICEELKEHYNSPWNRTKATLRRVYFNNLWKGTATVAAVILLLLTIIQTICSILQVV